MSVPYLTFMDCLDHIVDVEFGAAQDRQQTLYKRVIREAYLDLQQKYPWDYSLTEYNILLNTSYSTGTVDYDHCVTPEHEALTRDGWKTHDQLKIGDEILAFDPKTNTCRWSPLQDIHRSYFNGNLMRVERRGHAVLRCTPNHKFPATKRTTKGGDRRWSPLEFVKARDITADYMVPLCAPLEFPEESALSPRLAAILAWAITDGHGLLDKEKDYGARISQSSAVNRENCEAIGLLTRTRQCGPNKHGISSWCISAATAREIHQVIRKTSELPALVMRLSREAAQAMFDAMLAAEGSCTAAGRFCFTQWREHRKPIAEAFQILSNLLGRPANLKEKTYSDGVRYQVTVRTSTHFKPAKYEQKEPYSGLIWCPQVATGAWLCRCNGNVTVTGNSGGSSERIVTLTTGTWPSWAANGRIRIGTKTYQIEQRISNSIIQLDSVINPGADVASTSDWTIYQCDYDLPDDFQSLAFISRDAQYANACYVEPEIWLERNIVTQNAGQPYYWTIMRSLEAGSEGKWQLRLTGYPNEAVPLRFIYRRIQIDPTLSGLETKCTAGTVAVSASATVTGTSTSFDSSMVGAIWRIGDATNVPSGNDGLYPFVEERRIRSVESTTSLTLTSASAQTLSGKKYQISSLIDVPQTARNALWRGIEYYLATLQKDQAVIGRKSSLYRYALFDAMAAATRNTAPKAADGRWIPILDQSASLPHHVLSSSTSS